MNKTEVAALARKIQREIRESYKEYNDQIIADKNIERDKVFKNIPEYDDIKVVQNLLDRYGITDFDLSTYNRDTCKRDNINFLESLKNKLYPIKYTIKKTPDIDDLEDDIVLAQIDSDNLDSLIATIKAKYEDQV